MKKILLFLLLLHLCLVIHAQRGCLNIQMRWLFSFHTLRFALYGFLLRINSVVTDSNLVRIY